MRSSSCVPHVQAEAHWDYGREDGRLDTKRFTQAFNGRPNVFKMRTDRSELDTQ